MAKPSEGTTTEQWVSFLDALDQEGGIEGLLYYGGPGMFPREIQDLAFQVDSGIADINAYILENA